MSVTVLLADDHRILREGLRSLLEQQPDIRVVGEAGDGRAAVRLAKELSPDLVIMDIGMSGLNGVEATRQIREALPQTRVLALSMHSDRRYVRSMLTAGATGYLLKDSAAEELVQALRSLILGRAYLSPGITGVVLDEYLHADAMSQAADPLSLREREVLQLLAEGRSTSQIAAGLHVSVKTIETHRKRIMDKLGLHSIAELTRYAIREGITPLE